MRSHALEATLTTTSLAVIENGHWRPGISDPTVMGAAIFVAYFLGAAVCLFRAWRAHGAPGPGPFRFWLFCGLALVAFGINKQLDLHQLITQTGRDWSRAGGWYESRRQVQLIFFLCVAGVVVTGLTVLLWALRAMPARFYGALFGLVLLGLYVLIRAASFNHVDQFLGLGTDGFRLAWLVEIGGIAVTAGMALLSREGSRSDAAPKRTSVSVSPPPGGGDSQ